MFEGCSFSIFAPVNVLSYMDGTAPHKNTVILIVCTVIYVGTYIYKQYKYIDRKIFIVRYKQCHAGRTKQEKYIFTLIVT